MNRIDKYYINDRVENKCYYGNQDGFTECEELYIFSNYANSRYSLLGIKKDGTYHWYMNDINNEVLQTEDAPKLADLSFDSGMFLMKDSQGHVKLHDQYGNVLLGDKENYQYLGSNYYMREVMNISGTVKSRSYIQDGFVLTRDEAGDFSFVEVDIKYEPTGEVHVTIESEDASYAVDNLDVKRQEEAGTRQEAAQKVREADGCYPNKWELYEFIAKDVQGNDEELQEGLKVTLELPQDWDTTQELQVYGELPEGTYESVEYFVEGQRLIFYTSAAKKYTVALWGDFSIGDLDNSGAVDLADVQTALRAALKITTLREAQRKASDVDGNGNVDLADAWKLLRVVLKVESL